MVETIRFRKIYLEDLRTGSGSESVTLADGSIVALTKISLSSLGGAGSLDYLELAEQSATPSTPGSGTVRIYRKTNNKQYLLDDAGTETEWPFTLGTITSGVWNGTAIAAGYGGTGLATYVIGDLLYASATTTLAKLAAVATGQVLISSGAATAPAWSSVLYLSGAGPHAIGGVTSALTQLQLLGAFTGTRGYDWTGTLTASSGIPVYGMALEGTLVEFSAGTHSEISGLFVSPTFTGGAAASTRVTSASFYPMTLGAGVEYGATVYISGAPTGATYNYAAWIDAGMFRYDATTQTTVGAAGGATALPATPTGYWKLNIGGTEFVVPYYAVS